MKKVLVATDGSPSADEAIEYGLELASDEGAHVTFLRVVPTPEGPHSREFRTAGPVPEWMTSDCYTPLSAAIQLAIERGVTAKAELISGDPVEVIVAYADSIEADMIVLGSRGHGAVAAALLGSVSRSVLRDARRPVLVVRGVRMHAPRDIPVPA